MTLEKLKQIIQDESVSGRLKALEEFEESLSKQKNSLKNYLNNEVHKQVNYEVYSDLMDFVDELGE